MDVTNFKENFLSSAHNRKMVNIEYSAEFLIPNIYRYQDLRKQFSPSQIFCICWVAEIYMLTHLLLSIFLP